LIAADHLGVGVSEVTVAALEEKVATASTLYHRVVFLVGQSSKSRTEVLASAASKHGWPLVNVGLAFSERLIDVPRRYRAVQAPNVLADLLPGIPGLVLLLDHIEILFSPDLSQDPVKLLQGLSRNRRLVVSWPGDHTASTLSYAEPGHPEYYRQPIPELMKVELSGAA
jgi:hypothetical protein